MCFSSPLIRPSVCYVSGISYITKARQLQGIISIGRFHLNETQDMKFDEGKARSFKAVFKPNQVLDFVMPH